MNKREKEVIKQQLNSEKEVLEKIKGVYEDALTGINDKIKLLMSDELTQSKIYQIEYQKALKGQISVILDAMNDQQYEKVSDYLQNCYDDGFIGTMYNLQGQGVPLVIPIDQEQIVQAIEKDTKLSEPLYKRLGQDVNELKTAINAEISRGIASALPYSDIALNVKNRTNVGINRTMTIARTEGHRVSQEASYHAQIKAKERGADIVKEWDATLDSRTRKSHAALDGQIRELDEPFEINGRKAMHPSDFGVASEDVNCRCVCLQRAKWAITDEEFTKMNGDTGELIRMTEKNYQSFKDSYKDPAEPSKLRKALEDEGVQYLEVERLSRNLSSDEIIERLGGGDRIADWVNGKPDKAMDKYAKSMGYAPKNLKDPETAKPLIKPQLTAKDLSPELQKTLTKYTDGGYTDICEYSQYLKVGNDNGKVSWWYDDAKAWEDSRLSEISDATRKDTVALINTIDNQPISKTKLTRIERAAYDGEVGDEITFGIRSASRNTTMLDDLVTGKEDALMEFTDENNTGRWTEYILDSSKSLPIDDVSVYSNQKENIICGKYRVKSVDEIPITYGGWTTKDVPLEECLESKNVAVTGYKSKTGKDMIKYKNERGGETSMLKSQYLNKMELVNEYIKPVVGRKVVHLEYVQ